MKLALAWMFVGCAIFVGCGPGSGDDEPASGSEAGTSQGADTGTTEGGGSQSGAQDTSTGADPSSSGSGGAIDWDLDCEIEPILLPSGQPSGFATCDGGLPHRVEAVTCEVPAPPETCEAVSEVEGSCSTSAECTDGPHGACLDDGVIDPSVSQGCRCVYSCETDADCDAGSVCGCLGDRPQCLPGECATGDDCNGLCMLLTISGDCGGSTSSLVCLDLEDECRPDIEQTCPIEPGCVDGMERAPCEHSSSGWVCGEPPCPGSCG